MSNRFKRLASVAGWCLLLLFFFAPALALADDDTARDARLEGYSLDVAMPQPGSGTGLTWLLFVGLMIVCVGVVFKNPRRTHLD